MRGFVQNAMILNTIIVHAECVVNVIIDGLEESMVFYQKNHSIDLVKNVENLPL